MHAMHASMQYGDPKSSPPELSDLKISTSSFSTMANSQGPSRLLRVECKCGSWRLYPVSSWWRQRRRSCCCAECCLRLGIKQAGTQPGTCRRFHWLLGTNFLGWALIVLIVDLSSLGEKKLPCSACLTSHFPTAYNSYILYMPTLIFLRLINCKSPT